MKDLQKKLPRKKRLERVFQWVEEAEESARELASQEDATDAQKRAVAWQFAKTMAEARALKQAEAIGRLHLAFQPLIVRIPYTKAGFGILSDKMKQYDKCRRACKRRWKNRFFRDACISYCIAQLLQCMKPDESPN